MNEKKDYSAADNVRGIYFMMKKMTEDIQKIAETLSSISAVLLKKKDGQ